MYLSAFTPCTRIPADLSTQLSPSFSTTYQPQSLPGEKPYSRLRTGCLLPFATGGRPIDTRRQLRAQRRGRAAAQASSHLSTSCTVLYNWRGIGWGFREG
ncbi:hypothetical protein PsYK624_153120 [Phanerochaete sordida]|uniref:Uncharacterized protein n=1 Tax=Phanerochaete sordida TaxID=48140 RepID=A0A9P3LL06_9APHY|nr:hypothetical protein PsYK624_153120 [Phanerochaete sordida]